MHGLLLLSNYHFHLHQFPFQGLLHLPIDLMFCLHQEKKHVTWIKLFECDIEQKSIGGEHICFFSFFHLTEHNTHIGGQIQ